jgi:hypothetical protein
MKKSTFLSRIQGCKYNETCLPEKRIYKRISQPFLATKSCPEEFRFLALFNARFSDRKKHIPAGKTPLPFQKISKISRSP